MALGNRICILQVFQLVNRKRIQESLQLIRRTNNRYLVHHESGRKIKEELREGRRHNRNYVRELARYAIVVPRGRLR